MSKNVRSPTKEEHDQFYKLTYTYDGEDWSRSIAEGADEDETMRSIFVYKVCEEFKIKNMLCTIWRDLHNYVVCPLYKNLQNDNLMDSYVSFISKKYTLDIDKVKKIRDDVYNDNESEEDMYIANNFIFEILDGLKTTDCNPVKKIKIPKPIEKEELDILKKNMKNSFDEPVKESNIDKSDDNDIEVLVNPKKPKIKIPKPIEKEELDILKKNMKNSFDEPVKESSL
jgi:hypothetical protein